MSDKKVENTYYVTDSSPERIERRAKHKAEYEAKLNKERLGEEKSSQRGKDLKKYITIFSVVLVLLLVVFGNLLVKVARLSKSREEAIQKLDELQTKVEELEKTLDTVTSPEYIEQQAREQLHMIKEGEVLVVVK